MVDTLTIRPVGLKFSEAVPLASILPINTGLSSATEHTMVSILGSPKMPLTTRNQEDRASDLAKKLMTEKVNITPQFQVRGLKPAVTSLQAVLDEAFSHEPEMKDVLGTEGMISVRLRKPTDGSVSKAISNHAWGTAVDLKLVEGVAPGNTHDHVPRYIAILVPYFNRAGWFSGIAFHDTMHFEVAEETIRTWSKDGKLKPT